MNAQQRGWAANLFLLLAVISIYLAKESYEWGESWVDARVYYALAIGCSLVMIGFVFSLGDPKIKVLRRKIIREKFRRRAILHFLRSQAHQPYVPAKDKEYIIAYVRRMRKGVYASSNSNDDGHGGVYQTHDRRQRSGQIPKVHHETSDT